jgi:hypothetical protein
MGIKETRKKNEEFMADLKDKHGMTDMEARAIELMGDTVLTMCRLLRDMGACSPQMTALGAKKIFDLRDAMLEVMPMPKPEGKGLLFGFCIRCERDGLDPTVCPHHDVHRAAIFCLALLRVYPDYDLDVMAEVESAGDNHEA